MSPTSYRKTVWMYWENPPGHSKPVYLDLCVETITRHLGSYALQLLDEQSVTDYIDLPERIRHPGIPPDRRADYIRYALLYQYGGVWLDHDCILVRDVDDMVEPYVEQAGFVIGTDTTTSGLHTPPQGGPHKPIMAYYSVMASVPGCEILNETLRAMHHAVSYFSLPGLKSRFASFIRQSVWRASSGPVSWTGYDTSMLKHILPKHEFYAHPVSRLGLSWSRHKEYYQEIEDISAYLTNKPFCFNLYHSSGGMGRDLQHATRTQLLSGPSLLARLFRLALQEPERSGGGGG